MPKREIFYLCIYLCLLGKIIIIFFMVIKMYLALIFLSDMKDYVISFSSSCSCLCNCI